MLPKGASACLQKTFTKQETAMSQKPNETVADLTDLLRNTYADPSCGCCATGQEDPELVAEFDLWLHNIRMHWHRQGWNARAAQCTHSCINPQACTD